MSTPNEPSSFTPPAFTVDPDIRTAATPPSALYHEPAYFAHQQDAVFARSWHLVGDAREPRDDRIGEAVHAPGRVPR